LEFAQPANGRGPVSVAAVGKLLYEFGNFSVVIIVKDLRVSGARSVDADEKVGSRGEPVSGRG
jgi:hypothetical protein